MAKSKDRRRHAGKEPESSPTAVPSETGFRFSFGWQLAAVCGLAFFLRLLNVMQTFSVPSVVQLLGDAKGYVDWATTIAEGNWIGDETFYQAPLYPYFLAVLIKCFGPSYTVMRLVQAILGAIGVAAIGLAGRRMFSPRIGMLAAVMLAVYPPAIYYDGIIQKAALASVLLCGFLAAVVYTQYERRPWMSLLAGVLLGLLVITRENALLWVPLVPVWMLLGIDAPKKSRWLLAAALTAGVALILVPVAARNAMLGGEWSPTTFQAGPNFYIGNNLEANGIYRPLVTGHSTPMYERADAQRLAEQAEGRKLSAREVSKFWMKKAFGEIGQAPGRWIQLLVAKTFMVFNRYEVPDVESMHIYREYSAVLQLSRIWHFGILCPLGIWGLIATRSRWRELWLHYLLLLTMIAAITGFFILGRYRHPLAILLIPFAAAGMADLWQRVRNWQTAGEWRPITAATVAVLIAAVVCNLPVHEERSLNASSYMNLGIAAAKSGDVRESIRLFQHAIREFPEMGEAHFNLGRAWAMSGQLDRAVVSFRRARLLSPDLMTVDYYLGRTFEQMGDLQNAASHYQKELQLNPDDQRAASGLQRLRGS